MPASIPELVCCIAGSACCLDHPQVLLLCSRRTALSSLRSALLHSSRSTEARITLARTSPRRLPAFPSLRRACRIGWTVVACSDVATAARFRASAAVRSAPSGPIYECYLNEEGDGYRAQSDASVRTRVLQASGHRLAAFARRNLKRPAVRWMLQDRKTTRSETELAG
jgi:hypothetical protein